MARPQATHEVLVDDDKVRVTRWDFVPGAETGWHRHGMDYVVVTITPCAFLLEVQPVQHVDLGRLAMAGDANLVDRETGMGGDGLDERRHMAADISAIEAGRGHEGRRHDRGGKARWNEIAVGQAREQPHRPAQQARHDEAFIGEGEAEECRTGRARLPVPP